MFRFPPKVRINCDGPRCTSARDYQCQEMAGGLYQAEPDDIREELQERGWIIINDDEFCCEGCAVAAGKMEPTEDED